MHTRPCRTMLLLISATLLATTVRAETPAPAYADEVGAPCAQVDEFVASLLRCLHHKRAAPNYVARIVAIHRRGAAREDLIRAMFTTKGYLDRETSPREYVRDVYQAVLGREPSAAETTQWMAALDSGTTRYQVLAAVLGAPYAKRRADCGAAPASTNIPVGSVGLARCDYLSGEAYDPDSDWPVALRLELLRDGKRVLLAHITADRERDASPNAPTRRGLTWAIPDELRDGRPHELHVIAIDNTGNGEHPLRGSPVRIQCF